jgi:2-methylisocitrate lyase-like PEP mutase family enzyme
MSPDKAVSNGVEHVVGAATELRRFLEQSNKVLPCPGVYDGFSARIALQVGFDALYMVNFPSTS